MRRFLRMLFKAASALSLLLCIAACVLWVRSYYVRDEVERFDRNSPFEKSWNGDLVGYTREVAVDRGGLRITGTHEGRSVVEGYFRLGHEFRWTRSPASEYPLCSYFDPSKHDQHSAWGFQIVFPRSSEDETRYDILWIRSVTVPLLAVVAVTCVLPLLSFRSWHAGRLLRMTENRSLCSKCGYDLRATPDRCPECGTLSAK